MNKTQADLQQKQLKPNEEGARLQASRILPNLFGIVLKYHARKKEIFHIVNQLFRLQFEVRKREKERERERKRERQRQRQRQRDREKESERKKEKRRKSKGEREKNHNIK